MPLPLLPPVPPPPLLTLSPPPPQPTVSVVTRARVRKTRSLPSISSYSLRGDAPSELTRGGEHASHELGRAAEERVDLRVAVVLHRGARRRAEDDLRGSGVAVVIPARLPVAAGEVRRAEQGRRHVRAPGRIREIHVVRVERLAARRRRDLEVAPERRGADLGDL